MSNFDNVWEKEIYGQGKHLNRYPFDVVVTFVFRNAPREKPRDQVRILEIGSGAGNNLWFAAREGFQVTGIDGSPSAVAHARKRFEEEGLRGEFLVGDFTSLPFDDEQFDLAIDRGSLTCCGLSAAQRAMREVRRVLKPGGTAFFNPYSDRHTSHGSGTPGPDGMTLEAREGTLVGVGGICYYGRDDVDRLFASGWQVISVQHMEARELAGPQESVHAEWRVIARKSQ